MLSNQICKCSGGRPRSKPSGDSLATDLLRDKTVFAAPFYFCAIAINLALRMLWVLRLSPLPHWFPSPAVTAIVLELLELGRRWGWIFIRSVYVSAAMFLAWSAYLFLPPRYALLTLILSSGLQTGVGDACDSYTMTVLQIKISLKFLITSAAACSDGKIIHSAAAAAIY